jgi:hypothetical protein
MSEREQRRSHLWASKVAKRRTRGANRVPQPRSTRPATAPHTAPAAPRCASSYRAVVFAEALRAAFAKAGIEWPDGFRRCHDLRVTCGTNDVQAGMDNARLQAKLGHSDFRTTQRYINLAGKVFADEAEALERRLMGVEPSYQPERTGAHRGYEGGIARRLAPASGLARREDALSDGLHLAPSADVAQLVEHQLPKLRVAGSIPVVRSRFHTFG